MMFILMLPLSLYLYDIGEKINLLLIITSFFTLLPIVVRNISQHRFNLTRKTQPEFNVK